MFKKIAWVSIAAKHNIMYNNYKTTGYKYKTCKNLL